MLAVLQKEALELMPIEDGRYMLSKSSNRHGKHIKIERAVGCSLDSYNLPFLLLQRLWPDRGQSLNILMPDPVSWLFLYYATDNLPQAVLYKFAANVATHIGLDLAGRAVDKLKGFRPPSAAALAV